MKKIKASLAALSLALLAGAAQAEGQIRIAEQFGIVYLLLNVAQDQQLIEKHAAKAGVSARVEWVKLSGGAAVNDALLSGNIEIAGAGVGPLLTLWDRSYGRQNVRGEFGSGKRKENQRHQDPCEREYSRAVERSFAPPVPSP